MDSSTVSLSTDPAPLGPPPPAVFQPPSLHPQPPSLATVTSTATIANPTPPSLNHSNSNHPPYSEMIYAAIAALKEKDGSSKRAIAKYIEKAYTNLPPAHSNLLAHHLKRMRSHGQLVMVKKSYKLPRSDDPNTIPTIPPEINNTTDIPAHGSKPARGRGRPPKSNSNNVLVSLGLVDQPKRGPGRPKKTDGAVAVGQRGPKKGRGRPPKAKKRGPGRPKKPKSVAARLGPGRPPQAQDQLNPVPVSYVTSEGNVPLTPRPRGRPRKIATTAAAEGGVKQPPKKAENSSGRPVGRPKKNVLRALTETTEAQVALIGDLKRKLEFFQSKVRQAVGVLKPQLSSESQISAVAAIQELEGLAAMDIITPLREDTHPQAVQS